MTAQGFPGDTVVKNPPANTGATGEAVLIPGQETKLPRARWYGQKINNKKNVLRWYWVNAPSPLGPVPHTAKMLSEW